MSDTTPTSGNPSPGGGQPLQPQDLELLAQLGQANEWTRSLLWSLARRGTLLRQRDPRRAEALLGVLAAWPWYKAGQFVFDLLEWEDFIVDGPPPPEFRGDIDVVINRLVRLLRTWTSQLAGTPLEPAQDDSSSQEDASVTFEELPELEPGFYLYQDVVLGVLVSHSQSLRLNDK